VLGNKLTPPNSRFLGNKYIAQYTMGHKREPKSLSQGILIQSPYPEIVNNFNTPKSHQEPIRKFTK
jgi:hypothetical protein